MNITLSGKVALVTGASKGIGRAIATALAQAGAQVAFTYLHSAEKAAALEEELTALGNKVKGYCVDAGDFAATQEWIQQVLADFGQVDILVNNAGITRDGLLMRMDEAAWDVVLQTNLKSAFNTVKAITPAFMRQRGGAIINISSIVGRKGNAGQANYAASKAGLLGFTKSVALELGSRGIRANAIAPGFIATEMTAALSLEQREQWEKTIPLRRLGAVEDIAQSVVFLASDAAGYITAQVLSVDGGLYT